MSDTNFVSEILGLEPDVARNWVILIIVVLLGIRAIPHMIRVVDDSSRGLDVKSADMTWSELFFPWGLKLRQRRIRRELRHAAERVARARLLGLPDPEKLWEREGSYNIWEQRKERGDAIVEHPYDYDFLEANLPWHIGSKIRDRRIGLWPYTNAEILFPWGTKKMKQRTGLDDYSTFEVYSPWGEKQKQRRTGERDYRLIEVLLPNGETMWLRRKGKAENPPLVVEHVVNRYVTK